MAKMAIIASQTKLKDNASVNASALAMPLSLATNYGNSISSIGKAIGAIQADLHKIEDENQYNEVMPQITTDMSTAFNKYKNSSDVVTVPGLFEKDVAFSKWKTTLEPYNENVKRLVKQTVSENKIKLLSDLVTKVSDNAVYKYKDGIGKNFNKAMINIMSGDTALIGIGSAQFNNLINNKAHEEFIGAEEWKKITEAKQLQLAELMIENDIKFNSTTVIKNQELLVDVVGPAKALYYADKASKTLNATMKDLDRKNTYEEIKDQDDKVAVFTDMLLRIKAFKNDPSLINEAPTAAMLFDAFNDQFINESMFNMLTDALVDGNAQSDSKTVADITTAFYSAESLEMMEDIKRAVFLDGNILRKIGLQDLTAFTAIVDKAKKDFPAHKDKKKYAKLIDSNLASFMAGENTSAKKKMNFETLKQNVIMEYHNYIDQGYSAQNAYLKVLSSSSFLTEAVPTLAMTATPQWMKDIDFKAQMETAAKNNVSMFEQFNNKALFQFKGYFDPKANNGKGANVSGHGNYQQFLLELGQLDMLEKVYITRYNLLDGTEAEKLAYALEGKAPNMIDILGSK
tara:strand:+ start:13713 stop:15425 length:1713 start_codon:yes stop_codon:yes gene_type:complete